ncbi:MAG: class I SAM-dependent methyltransferase [Gammaproteobacteria bacterium]
MDSSQNGSLEFSQKDGGEVRNFWDSTALWRLSYFDDLAATDPGSLPRCLRYEQEFVIAEAVLIADEVLGASSRVVELGTGVGRSIHSLIKEYPSKHFIGVDFSFRQLAEFSSVLRRESLWNGDVVMADVRRLPLASATQDLALICNQTFGNFLGDTRQRALDEIRRVLKKSGRLYIGGFTNISIAADCYDAWDVEVKRIHQDTGFVELGHYNSWWQKEVDVNDQLANVGFTLDRSEHVKLGFLNVYISSAEPAGPASR